jgi:hypothetical protein
MADLRAPQQDPDLIRVFLIPEMPSGVCFGGGVPVTFTLVDWFKDHTGMLGTPDGVDGLRAWVAKKPYAQGGKPLLVLHRGHSFTINFDGKGHRVSVLEALFGPPINPYAETDR